MGLVRQEIRICCEGSDLLDIEEMSGFQGNLKSLSKQAYKQLKKEIVETGYAFPIKVWFDELSRFKIIGGHQTHRVLSELRKEGYIVPPIPVVKIHAASHKEAKRRVLQDIAQYGIVESQGLYEFMIEIDMGPGELMSDFKLPDIDLTKFAQDFFLDQSAENKDTPESKGSEEQDYQSFQHQCPKCKFRFSDDKDGIQSS